MVDAPESPALQETHSNRLGIGGWRGTYTDFKALADEVARVANEAAKDDVGLEITLNRDHGTVEMSDTKHLVEALSLPDKGGLNSIRVAAGHESDGVRIELHAPSALGDGGISGRVLGVSATAVQGAAAVLQGKLAQQKRRMVSIAWGGAAIVLCGLCALAASLLTLWDSYESPAMPVLFIAAGGSWLLGVLLMTFSLMRKGFRLVSDGRLSWRQRWGTRVAGGVWSVSLVVLGVVLGKVL